MKDGPVLMQRAPAGDAMRDARLKRFTNPSNQPSQSGSTKMPRSDAAPTEEDITSTGLFAMGFEPEAVGRALVETRGDAAEALKLLRTTRESTDEEEDDDDEDRQLERAIKLSLAASAQPQAPAQAASSSSSRGANPLWSPPRYMPAGGGAALEAGSRTLGLVETVQVRDGGYTYQAAKAFLDTGNQLMTLVDTRFAARHAIYKPDHARASLLGQRSAGFGQAERWTTIQGVVPGATTRAPVVTIALKVRDQEMVIEAAVSELSGHDLLIGADVLGRLFASGFRIGAGSM